MNFTEQLAAMRANLERLERLAAEHPDLFAHANLAEATPGQTRIFVHASDDRERDWRAWAMRFPIKWKLNPSPSNYSEWYDYDGEIEGVKISVLQAEPREQPKPLIAEPEVVA